MFFSKRILVIFGFFVFCGIIVFQIFASQIFLQKKQDTIKSDSYQADKKIIKIIALGDVMLGSRFPGNGKFLAPNHGRHLIRPCLPFFKGQDIVLANLEGVLNDHAVSTKCKTNKNCFAFAMPTRYGQILKNNQINVVNLANNHSNDFGRRGYETTVQTLTKLNILYTGFHKPVTYKTIGSTTIAILGFSYGIYKYGLSQFDQHKKLIQEAKKNSQIIIVNFHGGREGKKTNSKLPNTYVLRNQTEYAYGENRGNLEKFSKKCIDAGAHLVIGHGPHVPRGMQWYKKRLIAYSLGNFCTIKRFSLAGASAYAPVLSVYLDHAGNFVSGRIISCYQKNSSSGPVPDVQYRAAKLIRYLSKKNFPRSGVKINKNGQIVSPYLNQNIKN